MKRFNQNQTRANADGESKTRPAFFSNPPHKNNIKIVAAIFAVIILHFVAQFTFFRSEEISLKAAINSRQITEIESENEQSFEAKTEIAMKKPDAVKMPEVAAPPVPFEPKIVRSRFVIKKKEPRLSEAQRLRRAEKILTGV